MKFLDGDYEYRYLKNNMFAVIKNSNSHDKYFTFESQSFIYEGTPEKIILDLKDKVI